MLSLLTGIGVPVPIEQKTLTLIEEPPAQVQVEPELTVDQKIKSNYYKCNTEIEWIWAQDATCHPKQGVSPQSNPKPTEPIKNSSGGNLYEPGQCTWYVKNRRPDIPNSWGNASAWLGNAQAQGWTTSTTPVAGSIGWTSGHVVFVESVSGSTVVISEMNYDWTPYHQRTIEMPASKYIYIY